MNPFSRPPGDRGTSQPQATEGRAKHRVLGSPGLPQPCACFLPPGEVWGTLAPLLCWLSQKHTFFDRWGHRLLEPQAPWSLLAYLFQMTSLSVPGSPRRTSSASRQQPPLCKRELCA